MNRFQDKDGGWLSGQSLADVIVEHVGEFNATRDKFPMWTPRLWRTDMRYMCLPGVNFRNANLRSADLLRADLRGADLRGTCLADTNLLGTKLRGAHLEDADIEFSGGFPLWCGSFDIITGIQIEAQEAYHTLRRCPNYATMTDEQAEILRTARRAMIPVANLWNGIETHDLRRISENDV